MKSILPTALVLGSAIGLACGSTKSTTVVPMESRVIGFHGDRAKLGWVQSASFSTMDLRNYGLRPLWSSARLDAVTIQGVEFAPHFYASPLLAREVRIDVPLFHGSTDVVLAASSNGMVYAVSAGGAITAGTVLWRTTLTRPMQIPKLDGGVPLGVLSTPILNLDAPLGPTLYIASHDADRGWLVFAVLVSTGKILDRWPIVLDDASLSPKNLNGPARFHESYEMSQRGALALSPLGDRLYVSFGSFSFASVGWISAINTENATITSTFSTAPDVETRSNGGMWGAGGPAVDDHGYVYVATGNSPPGVADAPRTWGNSLLKFDRDLHLLERYTPFNYCKLDTNNIDLAGSAPMLLPDNPSATPHVMVFGGKQGNVYLIDRDHLLAAGDRRSPCSTDVSTDRSLHPPEAQPQFGARGPLNVFGPYTDDFGQVDYAKMRSRPAYFASKGAQYLYVSGATKAAADSTVSVPPSLARLRVVAEPGQQASLAIDRYNQVVSFVNPGSPVVVGGGNQGGQPTVWVIDENAKRSASLLDPSTPKPVLYVFDGETLELLAHTREGELEIGGKYVTVAVANGGVIVATDRIVAFGVGR